MIDVYGMTSFIHTVRQGWRQVLLYDSEFREQFGRRPEFYLRPLKLSLTFILLYSMSPTSLVTVLCSFRLDLLAVASRHSCWLLYNTGASRLCTRGTHCVPTVGREASSNIPTNREKTRHPLLAEPAII